MGNQGNENAAPAQQEALGAGGADQQADWAEFNRKNRVGSKSFASSYPLAHLIILKMSHDPLLKHVLAPLLHMAGNKWDIKNLAEAAAGKAYRFRLLDLARDYGFASFFGVVRDNIRNRNKWSALPPQSRSTAMSTWAFRLISRIAG